MKIVFVHFGREHLGLEYLSSVLKSNGHNVELVCDSGLFSREDNVFCSSFLEKVFSKKNIVKEIVNLKPDLVGFSPYTTTYLWACKIAKEIKESICAPIVFGGIHTTLVPQEILRNNFVDFAIAGEGEYALLELVENLSGKSSLDKIGNLWFKKNGKIISNKLHPPLNLDKVPFPDKNLFSNYVRFKDDYMTMCTRGCHFNCSYCCESYLNKIYEGKYFRRRSIENVISELKIMKSRYKFREMMFFDSIFFTDKMWVRNFLKEYQREISVPFRCTGHVLFFDFEFGKLMKESGCYCINFGVQTFNPNIRRVILNRSETNRDIKEAFNICDKLELRYDVDLVFGLPEIKLQDYLYTIEFMKEFKFLNRLKCYYLSFFPNTEIIERAKEFNILKDKDIDNINKGKTGDFFHLDSIKDTKHKRWKENFSKIYKIYPLIPDYLKNLVVQKMLYSWFHIIPNFFIVLLQLLIAIKNKDHRFKIYINSYLYNFKKKLLGKL